ncbi:MAG: ATP-binding protein, partial [Pseudomonadota bacterium]
MQQRFQAPPAEVFRPQERRMLRPSAFGMSRLALQLSAISLAGLFVLMLVVLSVAGMRMGAADAVTQSLLVQADAVAEVLSLPKADGTPRFTPEPEDETQGGNAARPRPAGTTVTETGRSDLDAPIGEVLEGSLTIARVFTPDGEPLVDTSNNNADTALLVGEAPGLVATIWDSVAGLIVQTDLPPEPPAEAKGEDYEEVQSAFGGIKATATRINANGDTLVSVATPLASDGETVLAVLQLRSAPGAVTAVARRQELAIVWVFLVAGLVAIALSFLMAATITRPIRRLARAADRIRKGGVTTAMPEFSDRGEVGELSRVLHDMTTALYARIDSIEAFAGEVAHELKNPLTSLKSAVETLPLARTDKSRDALLEVIQHDVERINRLISDISDASKLDAELNRHRYERLDLIELLQTVVNTQAEFGEERNQSVELAVRGDDDGTTFQILGNDSRLGQVFTNLIDNARSFTPEGRRVVTTAQRFSSFIEVVVDDEGPGIAEDSLERIFERFYTDRSGQSSFGNNSGLGLAISRQIIEAHGG